VKSKYILPIFLEQLADSMHSINYLQEEALGRNLADLIIPNELHPLFKQMPGNWKDNSDVR
jgi:hypothetical protein